MSQAELAEVMTFAEAWERLFEALPRDTQNEILCNPFGAEARALVAEVCDVVEMGVA